MKVHTERVASGGGGTEYNLVPAWFAGAAQCPQCIPLEYRSCLRSDNNLGSFPDLQALYPLENCWKSGQIRLLKDGDFDHFSSSFPMDRGTGGRESIPNCCQTSDMTYTPREYIVGTLRHPQTMPALDYIPLPPPEATLSVCTFICYSHHPLKRTTHFSGPVG